MKKLIISLSLSVLIILVSGSLVYGQSADLSIQIKCPGKAKAGDDLKETIEVFVTNSGKIGAKNFSVDLIISKNAAAPLKFAVYSATFKEDALLLGGREFVKYLGPGKTIKVKLNGNNRIPVNTPTGSYFLGAIVDAGNSVPEFNENNNMDFCSMKIKGGGTSIKSEYDLDITDIYLDDKCRIWIKHTNNGTKKIDKIFREKVWVNGVLKTDDTEHIVLLPGKWIAHGVGADPGVIVSGSASIKAKVDVDNVLTESNEVNNTKVKNVACKKKFKKIIGTIQMNPEIVTPKFVRRNCPDPAAFKIKFKLLNRLETSRGEVEIKGIVRNLGTKEFKGNGVAYLYEGRVLKKSKAFTRLSPRSIVELSFTRSWYLPDHDTPPEYKLLILYKPALSTVVSEKGKDCNLKNNKITKSGAGINNLFF